MKKLNFDEEFSSEIYQESRKSLIEEFDKKVRKLSRYTSPFSKKKSNISIEVSEAKNSLEAYSILGGIPDKNREAAYNFLEKIDNKDIRKRIIGPDILKWEKRKQLKKIVSALSIKK